MFVFVIVVILFYVVVRFRGLDERLNIMRRSLDSRVTDADVEGMISMVREHLGADMETRVEELTARIDLIEEQLPRACSKPIFVCNPQGLGEGVGAEASCSVDATDGVDGDDDDEAPPSETE